MGLLKCSKCGNIIFDMSNMGAVNCNDGGHYEEISLESIIPEILSSMKKINTIFENVKTLIELEKIKFDKEQSNIISKIIKKHKKNNKKVN